MDEQKSKRQDEEKRARRQFLKGMGMAAATLAALPVKIDREARSMPRQ